MVTIGLILLGCAAQTESPPLLTTMPALTAMGWTLSWRRDGAILTSDGTLSVSTDLGYEVTISEGFVVTSLVSLVPCDTNHDTGLAWALNWLLPPAYASHPPFDDPSLVELQAKESLAPPRDVELPSVDFERSVYCSVYWLVARGPPESDIEGTSVQAAGQWSRNGATGPISIDTNFARAFITGLPPMDADAHIAHGIVNRSLGTLFDGIDFETANGYTVGWGVVKNLTDQATFHWR